MGQKRKQTTRRAQSLLEGETGTIRKQAGSFIALGYPAPYQVAVSSLGFQTVYRVFNGVDGLACGRFFLQEGGGSGLPETVETGRSVADAKAVAFSISCETELLGMVELLESIGMPVLAEEREEGHPPVIVGGPLTWLDPRLVSRLADLVVVGEGEPALPELGRCLVQTEGKGDFLHCVREKGLPGVWVTREEEEPAAACHAGIELLPACAATWSARAEFKDLFLVEATRGCQRACAFCVLSGRGRAKGRFRSVPVERVLSAIPDEAPGVGLVGAAVTDHPEIEALVESTVRMGKRVSLSSIRADRLTDRLVCLLKAGGLRTLTVAADGSSSRLRRSIHKGISEDDLIRAAELAAVHDIRGIKVYSMIGLPGEDEDDIVSFVDLALKLNRILKTSLAVQAFVPKPGTPLAGAPMESLLVLQKRFELMKKMLQGRVRLMPTSTRWSWVDWKVAHSGERGVDIARLAFSGGGGFAAWKRGIGLVFGD